MRLRRREPPLPTPSPALLQRAGQQAGKNFPLRTPPIFARLLGLVAEKFSAAGLKNNKDSSKIIIEWVVAEVEVLFVY